MVRVSRECRTRVAPVSHECRSDVCVSQGAGGAEQTRDKRKFEGVTEAKFGIKNAVLGFVFGVSIPTIIE